MCLRNQHHLLTSWEHTELLNDFLLTHNCKVTCIACSGESEARNDIPLEWTFMWDIIHA
jgi:hypothetical protein